MNQNDGSSISTPPCSPIPKKNAYRKRKKTLKKKAEELSVLCDIPVALISVESTGKVDTWPEDRQLVDEILRAYVIKTAKNAPQTAVVDRNPNSGGERMKKRRKLMYDTWPAMLDFLPEYALVEILEKIERKEKLLDEVILGEDDDDHEMEELGFPMQEY